MAVEKDRPELLREMIRHVEGSVHPLEFNEVPLDPLAQHVILNIHVSSTRCWFLGIDHGITACNEMVIGNFVALENFFHEKLNMWSPYWSPFY